MNNLLNLWCFAIRDRIVVQDLHFLEDLVN